MVRRASSLALLLLYAQDAPLHPLRGHAPPIAGLTHPSCVLAPVAAPESVFVGEGSGAAPELSPPVFPSAASAESDAAAATIRRQLQANNPDKCTEDASYQGWLALVNQACCTKAASQCSNGMPTSCDTECANVMSPFKRYCKTQLQAAGIMDTVNTAYRTCERPPKNTRGCPKDIPSVSDSGAVQSCAGGSGFWPVGTACTVTCAAGGGHRRAQAGGSVYMCTSGGNWLAASPIQCASGPVAPPPPISQTAGRFQVYPQPMTITDAVSHCRNQVIPPLHLGSEKGGVLPSWSSCRRFLDLTIIAWPGRFARQHPFAGGAGAGGLRLQVHAHRRQQRRHRRR